MFFIIVCQFSCIKEYIPENQHNEQKIVAIAELEANQLTSIDISSTFSSTSPELFIDHEFTRISVINYESGSSKPEEYRYRPALETYKNDDFIPKEGQLYDFFADVKIEGIPVLHATTRIPYASRIENIELIDRSPYISEQGTVLEQFQINILVEPLKNVNTYYHLIPMIASSGQPIEEAENLNVSSVTNGENATFILSHRDGILIDETKLNSDNNLTLNLRTKSPFETGGTNESSLYFELRTVTEAYYNYHVSLSRQNDSNSGPFTLPVTTFTNIENGYGLFASFSTNLDSLQIE